MPESKNRVFLLGYVYNCDGEGSGGTTIDYVMMLHRVAIHKRNNKISTSLCALKPQTKFRLLNCSKALCIYMPICMCDPEYTTCFIFRFSLAEVSSYV